ncbi:hypothetical protein J4G37_24890 [Microvirga sp. 3-52]|nr:hypothetical protein [Microvirga sp. 3-52]
MVEAEGEQLIIDGPARALTDEIVAVVQTRKADLLQLIRPPEDRQCWHAEDWQAYFDERAAIREHDGGNLVLKQSTSHLRKRSRSGFG